MALTTFATPEGLHQYTPNISDAGDYYVRCFSDIFGHIPNAAHCMKDLVIYSRTYEEHINLLRILLKTANDNNVSFNKTRRSSPSPQLFFPQYEVSSDGFRPNPELTRAMREFQRLANITDLRSFYGLCQQGGNFSDKITAALAPLSPLLKKKSAKSGWPIRKRRFAPLAVHWPSFQTSFSTTRAAQHH